MTDPNPTIETLPTGETVLHYPDGRQVLQQTNSLANTLVAQFTENEAASEALQDTLVAAAVAKREALADGDTVPADKRVV